MKTIRIADHTLCRGEEDFSFRERIEISRQLENLQADVIELPAIENGKTDILLVKTVSSFVRRGVLSVETGLTRKGVENAAASLAAAAHPRLCVSVPVSPVGMEYTCHKKAPKLLELIRELVGAAHELCADVEFCAADATRAEVEFLVQAARTAVEAGATAVTVCDSEGAMMPDEFGAFTASFREKAALPESVEIGVQCCDSNGLACASAMLAVKNGASLVKTAVNDVSAAPLSVFAGILKNCGARGGFSANLKFTELRRILGQIAWIADGGANGRAVTTVNDADSAGIRLDSGDDAAAVEAAVRQLGYDLSEEDEGRVFEEFQRVAEKKNVGAKELDAIVASAALQVPQTFKLVSYVINTGNIISASAQIRLDHSGTDVTAIGMGDGPIDAAFLTIEQIVGHHYELDDFQIQAVTEGKEAMGSAVVKLRSGGKLYSGNGISTDIIGASIRAYLSALNKIIYEEE